MADNDNDPVIRLMQRLGIPVTRETYIELAFCSAVPEWSAELEAQLPAILRTDIVGVLARNRALIEESNRKYGGPPEPLTEEELDRSETEIHNMLRRGPPKAEPTS